MELKLEVPTILEPAVGLIRAEAPSSGYVNEWQRAVIEGHVEIALVENPGIGLAYIDGPADTITVVDPLTKREQVIRKGYVWTVYKTGWQQYCVTIGPYDFTFKVSEKGTYTLWLVAGYVSENKFRCTDYREVSFTAEERPPPIPWWEQKILGIPLWAWLVLGVGIVPVAAVAAVVAESERRKTFFRS